MTQWLAPSLSYNSSYLLSAYVLHYSIHLSPLSTTHFLHCAILWTWTIYTLSGIAYHTINNSFRGELSHIHIHPIIYILSDTVSHTINDSFHRDLSHIHVSMYHKIEYQEKRKNKNNNNKNKMNRYMDVCVCIYIYILKETTLEILFVKSKHFSWRENTYLYLHIERNCTGKKLDIFIYLYIHIERKYNEFTHYYP